ncbi:MAG: damage-inducible protein CinA [Alphaproteobacteria bacterium]|nr:damage-inducible protein CinA [Alphaproteobacteria bacterium]|tara:strand:- start:132 stop:638 length:507 start_codon:yes stop_codon:yes gene_type:complete
MFDDEIRHKVSSLLKACRAKGLHISTAESCTGGLIAAALTEISGSSDVFERGFVTYQDDAKAENLGVSRQTLTAHGAVSEPVAREMAAGTLDRSTSQVSVAVTGIAGPGGGSPQKPVGLVHIASASNEGASHHRRCEFGEIGREGIRDATIREALDMLTEIVAAYPSG